MTQEVFGSWPAAVSELHSTAASRPSAHAVWRTISAAASDSLGVGAVVYGIALGGGAALTSPVSTAAAAPVASGPNADDIGGRPPQGVAPGRGRGGGGHGRR